MAGSGEFTAPLDNASVPATVEFTMAPRFRPTPARFAAGALLFACLFTGRAAGADLSSAADLYKSRNYEEAARVLAELSQSEPGNAEVAYYSGLVARRQKRLDDAVKSFERAITLQPTNAEYHIALGDAYGALASKNRSFTYASRSRSALEKAVSLAPTSEKARAALIDYCREAPAIAGGGMGKAYAHAKEFRTLDPVAGTRLLAALYVHEKRYDDAIAACRETLQAHPADYSLLYQLGRTAAVSGSHVDEGIAALQKCLGLAAPEGFPGHAHAHVRLGQLCAHKQDLPAAREHFQAALAADPGNAEAKEGLDGLPPTEERK